MPYGQITRLEPAHGFGFIVDDAGLEWFFKRDGVRDDGFDRLWLDERVGFSSESTAHGPLAVDIHFEQLD